MGHFVRGIQRCLTPAGDVSIQGTLAWLVPDAGIGKPAEGPLVSKTSSRSRTLKRRALTLFSQAAIFIEPPPRHHFDAKVLPPLGSIRMLPIPHSQTTPYASCTLQWMSQC